MQRQWKHLQSDQNSVRIISDNLNCSPIMATLLANRKIDTAEAAFRFLHPSLSNIRPPFFLKDMPAAINRIAGAIAQKEKILIFGDYDADGVTATALLYEFFQQVKSNVSYYIPHRIKEGYSLNTDHIQQYAVPNGIRLIITVDCGSTSYEAIEAAKQVGVDVIVSDHHKISKNPPRALAVINPNRHDCKAGFEHLSGIGVAFCLVICLRKHLRDLNYWQRLSEPNLKQFCDLVAIGTVADIVPLVEENRIFTKTGLEVINSKSRYGITALVEKSRGNKNIAPSDIDADDIAFRLAPRINAAGRMDHAALAIELLTTKDPQKADQIAGALNTLNIKRQETEQKVTNDIIQKIEHSPSLREKRSLVLSDPNWHEGILGIAAARIAERYFRPVILISTTDGIGKGSARSIPGVDLYAGLSACANDLVDFGGHSMAAGLSIKSDRIDRFRKNFEHVIRKMTAETDSSPVLFIDHTLDFDNISPELINEIETLKPFGAENPEPIFTANNIRVLTSRIVGKKHRQMRLSQNGGKSTVHFQAIRFNIDPDQKCENGFDKVAFRLRWNRWDGNQTPQMIIEDVKAFA